MNIPASIQNFQFFHTTVQAWVPHYDWLLQQLEKKDNTAPPYWAQVWPAAKALCQVLANDPLLVKNKTVLEIAAGLGLPSLLAAQYANKVFATDYIEEAVAFIKKSGKLNQLQNLECRMLNWDKPGTKLKPDVLLLSDINYNPADFQQLYKLLIQFMADGASILLSTPQRLLAKPFMELLLPYKKTDYSIAVEHHAAEINISVWLLSQNPA